MLNVSARTLSGVRTLRRASHPKMRAWRRWACGRALRRPLIGGRFFILPGARIDDIKIAFPLNQIPLKEWHEQVSFNSRTPHEGY